MFAKLKEKTIRREGSQALLSLRGAAPSSTITVLRTRCDVRRNGIWHNYNWRKGVTHRPLSEDVGEDLRRSGIYVAIDTLRGHIVGRNAI